MGLECSTQFSTVNGCTKLRLHSRHIPRRNYPFAFYFPRLPHLCPLTVICFQLYMLSFQGCSVEESYGLSFGRGSLSTVPLRSIHVAVVLSGWCSSFVNMTEPVLVNPFSSEEHLACYQSSKIANKTSQNIQGRFLHQSKFICQGRMPKNVITTLYGKYTVSFLVQRDFPRMTVSSSSHQQHMWPGFRSP